MLLTCSESINIYNLDNITNEKQTPIFSSSTVHKSSSSFATFTHNNKVIASGGDDGIIQFIDSHLNPIQPIIDNDIVSCTITSLCFSHDSRWLAYASNNGIFKIYNISNAEKIWECRLPNTYVTNILFNNDSSQLVISTKNGDIFTYLAPTFTSSTFKLQWTSGITNMKMSPFFPEIIGVSTEDGSIKIINLTNGDISCNFTGYHFGPATGIAFSPVSKVFICSCGWDGKINFFDISNMKKEMIKTIIVNSPLTGTTFVNEGDAIITSDDKGYVYLYDLRNSERPKCVFVGNKGVIRHVEIGKNVKLNTSGSSKGNRGGNSFQKGQSNQLQGDTSVNSIGKNDSNNTSFTKEKRSALIESNSNTNMMKGGTATTGKITTGSSGQKNMTNAAKMQNTSNTNNNNNTNNMWGKGVNKALPFENILNWNNNQSGSGNNQMQVDEHYEMRNCFEKSGNSNRVKESAIEKVDPNIQNFIQRCVENESSKLKNFIHDEINTLHVDIIRQFEIQQAELMQTIKSFSWLNNKMASEIENLKKENENLKSQFF